MRLLDAMKSPKLSANQRPAALPRVAVPGLSQVSRQQIHLIGMLDHAKVTNLTFILMAGLLGDSICILL